MAGILDLTNGELTFCNAGHDAPFLISGSEAPEQIDQAHGPPIGVVPRNATAQRLMMRPRMSGRAASCSVLLPTARNVTLAAPTMVSAASSSGSVGAAAAFLRHLHGHQASVAQRAGARQDNQVDAGLFSFNSKGACDNCKGAGHTRTPRLRIHSSTMAFRMVRSTKNLI